VCTHLSGSLTHSLDLCLLLAVGSGSAQELRLFYPTSASFYVCHAGRDRAGSNGLHCSVASFCVVVVAGRRAHGPGPASGLFGDLILNARTSKLRAQPASPARCLGLAGCGGTMCYLLCTSALHCASAPGGDKQVRFDMHAQYVAHVGNLP